MKLKNITLDYPPLSNSQLRYCETTYSSKLPTKNPS